MNTPNAAAERVARSTIAEGWVRICIMALVPITVGLGGWIGVSIIGQGERLAVAEGRINDTREEVRGLLARALVADTARASSEAQMRAIQDDVRAVKDMLTEALRDRRSELSLPRRPSSP